MNLKTFETFKKLMERTTSDSDAESLNALRAANRLLTKEGLSWTRVLDRSVRVVAEYEEHQPENPKSRRTENGTTKANDEEIERAFEILSDIKGGFSDFIESLYEQWTERRWLSRKQRDALLSAVERNERK